MKFKLKYQISQKIDIETSEIINKARVQLVDKGYRILNITGNNIKFDTYLWEIGFNFSPRKLSDGEIEIVTTDTCKSLQLNYYVNFLPPAILLLLCSVLIIAESIVTGNEDYWGILFFAVFLIFAGLIDIGISQGKAEEMLEEIIN